MEETAPHRAGTRRAVTNRLPRVSSWACSAATGTGRIIEVESSGPDDLPNAMSQSNLSAARARQIMNAASRVRVLVVGDVMLDQFIWGNVARISPEAPVPAVDFARESFMPGGPPNVPRNRPAPN